MDGGMGARERLQDFTRNGAKVRPTFSAAEMQRRLDAVRRVMSEGGIDAALFTSYHNINYYGDFLHCSFGRRYGLVVTPEAATSISLEAAPRAWTSASTLSARARSPVCT